MFVKLAATLVLGSPPDCLRPMFPKFALTGVAESPESRTSTDARARA